MMEGERPWSWLAAEEEGVVGWRLDELQLDCSATAEAEAASVEEHPGSAPAAVAPAAVDV